jgi:hypothetical protein
MKKIKFIAFVLVFMLPLLSCYSQSNNKKEDKTLSNQKDTSKKDEANKANSAAVSSFIGKLMSNKQDTSKIVKRNHANSAVVEKNNNRNNANSRGKAYLSCPDNNHPHMIDLGLPSGTKWACCNVGASTPDGYGGYYAWGETEEKRLYTWKTYLHCDDTRYTCHNLGSSICCTRYDVAHVKWGGSWRMPTHEEQLELIENCTWKWIYSQGNYTGVHGLLITGPSGGSIFLPASGYRNNIDDYVGHDEFYCYYRGANGYYWSGTQHSNYGTDALTLFFSQNRSRTYWNFSNRFIGFSVRPVSL